MVRFLSIGIECFSALIFIIPALLILRYIFWKQQSIGKVILIFIFSVYSMAVFSVTGIPAVHTIQVNFSFNFIPLLDIINSPAAYIKNSVLNIILFVPMGFLLPVIWEEYRPVRKTVCMGLAISAAIEVLQIFTFRLTDIDDLMMNTLGTISGYYAAKIFSFQLPVKLSVKEKNRSAGYEPVVILAIIFLIGFFLKPLVSNVLWNFVLSSPLWETIK